MSVDWITVIAQVINFLILVWLLKRFLYQPVMSAMQRREARIAERLETADQRERDADQAREQFEADQAQLARDRKTLLDKARADVDQQKKAWLDEAHAEIQSLRDQWHRQIREEQSEFLTHVRREATQTLMTLMSQALSDLADQRLEAAIVSRCLSQLQQLDDDQLHQLVSDMARLTVRSRFDLDADDRNRLSQQLTERLGRSIDLDYEQAPELIAGIEILGDGQRLSWNLADYMTALDDRVTALLSPAGAPPTETPHHA